MRLPALLGRIAYILAYPAIRLAVWRSHRAYVLIVCDNDILLTKNWMGLQRIWRLPGGGVHRSEPSHIAAVRELHEELGLVAPPDELYTLNTAPLRAGGGYTYDVFVWRLDQKPATIAQRHEIFETTWQDIATVDGRCSEHVVAAARLLHMLY